MAKITVFANGRARHVEEGLTVAGLMGQLKLHPRMILVEKNGAALHRHEWDGSVLEHGDRLEFVRVVAGG
jgi:thiamine biosynthesis protein ThiS